MSDPIFPSVCPAAPDPSLVPAPPAQVSDPVQSTDASSELTESPAKPFCLTPRQKEMLDQLADGSSIADAARIVGVSRNTIYRWLRDDPVVRAAYNKWKLACEESARARLVALQDTAVDVLTEELETKRSVRVAALLLDKMGVLTRPKSGSTDARRTAAEIELDRREQSAELYERSENLRAKEQLTGNQPIWPREALATPAKPQ